jgi:hypothetical protein
MGGVTVIPRKHEIEAVAAILTSGDFDSEQEMAKAIIKLVADDLSKRVTTGVSVGFPGQRPGLAIGPFYDLKSARRCLTDAGEAGLVGHLARLSGSASIAAVEAAKRKCANCGHFTELHVFGTCAVTKCDCEGVAYSE